LKLVGSYFALLIIGRGVLPTVKRFLANGNRHADFNPYVGTVCPGMKLRFDNLCNEIFGRVAHAYFSFR